MPDPANAVVLHLYTILLSVVSVNLWLRRARIAKETLRERPYSHNCYYSVLSNIAINFICLFSFNLKSKETEIFHPRVHFQNACKSWGWTRLSSGVRNSIQVFCVGGRDPATESFSAASQGAHQNQKQSRSSEPVQNVGIPSGISAAEQKPAPAVNLLLCLIHKLKVHHGSVCIGKTGIYLCVYRVCQQLWFQASTGGLEYISRAQQGTTIFEVLPSFSFKKKR